MVACRATDAVEGMARRGESCGLGSGSASSAESRLDGGRGVGRVEFDAGGHFGGADWAAAAATSASKPSGRVRGGADVSTARSLAVVSVAVRLRDDLRGFGPTSGRDAAEFIAGASAEDLALCLRDKIAGTRAGGPVGQGRRERGWAKLGGGQLVIVGWSRLGCGSRCGRGIGGFGYLLGRID